MRKASYMHCAWREPYDMDIWRRWDDVRGEMREGEAPYLEVEYLEHGARMTGISKVPKGFHVEKSGISLNLPVLKVGESVVEEFEEEWR